MASYRELMDERNRAARADYEAHVGRAHKAAAGVLSLVFKRQAWEAQNARREGTPLDVLGADGAASAKEFLADMAADGFPGATKFGEKPNGNGRRGLWHTNGSASNGHHPSMRGYPIGYVNPTEHWVDLQGNTPRMVVLCEDGALRTAATAVDLAGQRLSPVTTAPLEALPFDRDTLETVAPQIGTYAHIQTGTVGVGSDETPYMAARFVPLKLDTALFTLASTGSLPGYAY